MKASKAKQSETKEEQARRTGQEQIKHSLPFGLPSCRPSIRSPLNSPYLPHTPPHITHKYTNTSNTQIDSSLYSIQHALSPSNI